MPLVEHLYELRSRLLKSILAIIVAMVLVGVVLYQPVFDFLREPYCRTPAAGKDCALYVRDIFGQFQVRLRVSGIAGVVLAAPVWLYQLGAFITPALHRRERKYAGAFLGASLVLFGVGVFFAYLTMDKGLQFLLTVGGNGLVALPDLQSYLSFVTLTLLAFGVSFLFPVVLVFLNVAGVLSAAQLTGMWRGMVVGLAFFSAVITPSQDPITFLAMAVPLWLLYGVCVLIAVLRERAVRRRPGEAGLAELPDDEPSYVDPAPSQL
ncbi:MAG: twin-arginine translocase subunit TatC [Mycobacteriales bacterium]